MPHRTLHLFASLATLILLLVLVPAGLQAQTGPVSVGECAPRVPDVAALDGGGFVAVWIEDAQIPDSEFFGQVIWGRLFDSAGNPQGPRMRLAPTVGDPVAVRVVPSGDGGFLIAFRENNDLRIVDFAGDGTSNDFVLGFWNRPTPTLAAGAEDFLSLVSTPSADEFQVLRFLASGTVSSTATLQEGNDVSPRGFAGVVLAGGDSAIAYLAFPAPMPPDLPIANEKTPLRLQRFATDGTPVGDPRIVAEDAAHVDAAARPDGGLVLVYLEPPEDFGMSRLVAEVLDAELETVERIEIEETDGLGLPAVSVSPDGSNFTVAWTRPITPSLHGIESEVLIRTFQMDGTPRGPEAQVAASLPVEAGTLPNPVVDPRLTHSSPNGVTVTWWHLVFDSSSAFCSSSEGAFVDVVDTLPPCPEGNLCLQDERFAVGVTWEDPRSGDSGVGTPSPVTDDTGTFWFFDGQNLELMVKVLDARPVNGHFWVFFGSLTDVEFELTVTDLATGDERTYTNPPFEMASQADTTAFDGEP